MGQLQDIQKVFGSQEQEQQSLMILCFLKQSQYDELELQYYKFKSNLNVFPSIVMGPYKIFINDGEIFQNSQEFLDYIQCVILEGDLKRIVIFMDGSFQQLFINNYCKIYLYETYNQIFEIVVFDDKITASYCQLIELFVILVNSNFEFTHFLCKSWQNFHFYHRMTTLYQNNIGKISQFLLIDSNSFQTFYKTLGNSLYLQSNKVDEQIIEIVGQLIEIELKKSNELQFESVTEFELAFTNFTEFRNQLVQKLFGQIPKIKNNNNIIQGKFNYQIMKQINRYTNLVFDQLFESIQKFQQTFYFCQYCQLYKYQYGDRYISSAFFNGYFKNKSCQNCSYSLASFDNLKTLYQQKRKGFSIDHCFIKINFLQNYLTILIPNSHYPFIIAFSIVSSRIKTLLIDLKKEKEFQLILINSNFYFQQVQNQPVLAQNNSPTALKKVNSFNHIILIGKTGVGKTTLFNLLCNGNIMRFNEPTQKPNIKKCLNIGGENFSQFLCYTQIQKSHNMTIQDTPPFELENRDSIENSEKAKETFSNILTKQSVSQIFIVVKYDRFPVMKQSQFDCIKFLFPFKDIISIIIFNDDERQVADSQNDFEKIFETKKILICNLRVQPVTLNQDIQNHLINIRAKPEQLNLVNTDFDLKKKKKQQKVFLKNLEKLNAQKNEDDIQKLIQENKDISKKLEQLNKEQLELIMKLNSNQQKIQDVYSGMIQKSNNAI